MCPIYKKGNREDPGNYHPISLTSIVCKLMETALKAPILSHVQQTATLSAVQFHSTPFLPLQHPAEERITRLMDSGEGVGPVNPDFANAFECHMISCSPTVFTDPSWTGHGHSCPTARFRRASQSPIQPRYLHAVVSLRVQSSALTSF